MKINTHIGNVDIKINTKFNERISEAQKLLNMQIAADCEPLIPFRQGALRGSQWYPKGIYGDEIEWDTIYARYIYMGEIYGPNIPIRDAEGNITGWWSPPKKQPTGRQMRYHEPGTVAKFFEVAKEQHRQDWLRLVRETVGKG